VLDDAHQPGRGIETARIEGKMLLDGIGASGKGIAMFMKLVAKNYG
jgi:hypothetical protein